MENRVERRSELLARLERLGPGLRRSLGESERRSEFLARFGGVTLHQLSALRHLVALGPLTMHELAGRMDISPSAATQLVDRLVQHQLVDRVPDPTDRRVLRVAISESAAEVVRAFEMERSRRLAGLLAALSEDELETLTSLAERIARSALPGPAGPEDDASGGCL